MSLIKFVLVLTIAVFNTKIVNAAGAGAPAAAPARDCSAVRGVCRHSCEKNLIEIPGGAICQEFGFGNKFQISPKCCITKQAAGKLAAIRKYYNDGGWKGWVNGPLFGGRGVKRGTSKRNLRPSSSMKKKSNLRTVNKM